MIIDCSECSCLPVETFDEIIRKTSRKVLIKEYANYISKLIEIFMVPVLILMHVTGPHLLCGWLGLLGYLTLFVNTIFMAALLMLNAFCMATFISLTFAIKTKDLSVCWFYSFGQFIQLLCYVSTVRLIFRGSLSVLLNLRRVNYILHSKTVMESSDVLE